MRLFVGFLTATLAWLIWTLSKRAKTLVPRIVIVASALGIGATVWSPRPLLFGLIFMAVTLLVLDRRLPVWVLLPVMWAWVNSHGSFPLGIAVILVTLLGTHLDKADISWESKCLRWALGGLVGGVISPLGPALIGFPVRLLSKQDTLSRIIEWKSPSFSSLSTRLFLVQMLIACLLLVRRPSYRTALPMVVFIGAALLGSRNVAIASIVFVPGMAKGFEGLGVLDGREGRKGLPVMIGCIGLVGILLVRASFTSPGYDLSEYPVDAVSMIDQSGWHSGEVHVASRELVGNYLTLIYGTEAHVFFDDRFDMYPDLVIDDAMTLLDASPRWRNVLTERGIDVVIWESDSPLALLLREDPNWRIVHQDTNWMVACNRVSDRLADVARIGGAEC